MVCFFDTSTPEFYRKKVDAIAENYQNFRPFYIDGREGLEESVMQEMKKDIKKEAFVITLRLDITALTKHINFDQRHI